MPVSLTEISTVPLACLALIPIRPPSGVNFTALESRLRRICLILRSSPTKSPRRSSNCNVEVDAMLGSPLPHKGAGIIYCQREIERSNLKLHPPSLDLGKIQDLIDKGEQMATGGEDVFCVLGLFL